MKRFVVEDARVRAALVAALLLGCGARTELDTSAGAGSGAGGASVSSASGAGGTGGSPPMPVCPDDVCDADGCAPVRLIEINPFTEGDLAVEAPWVCVSTNIAGDARYACFNRCGGDPILNAADPGYTVGLLLDGGALTSAAGVSSPDSFVHVLRRDLASSHPDTAKQVWTDVTAFQLDNLARAGDMLFFSWTGGPPDEGIYRMPYDGGAPMRMSNWRVEPAPHAMVLNSGLLYISSDDPAHYGIATLDVAGGLAPSFIRAAQFLIAGMAVAADRVFWSEIDTDATSKDSTIRSMRPDGSDEKLLAELPTQIVDLIADTERIYFTTTDASGMALVAMPHAGGPTTTIVAGEDRVDRLSSDADYLFYVGHDGVYRVKKPAP